MRIFNKTAPNRFNIESRFEAGIELLGSEVKAIRLGHVDLGSSYVKLMNGEAKLINAKIFPYKYSRVEGYQEDRTRKLLLHKKEILSIKNKLDTGKYTIAPLSIYENHGKFKLEIGVAKGKKQNERRKDAKQHSIQRNLDRELKNEF